MGPGNSASFRQSPSSSGEGRAELSLQKTSSSQGLLCFSSQMKNIRITIREISYLIRCRRESGNFLKEISFGDFLTRIESWVGERERERERDRFCNQVSRWHRKLAFAMKIISWFFAQKQCNISSLWVYKDNYSYFILVQLSLCVQRQLMKPYQT